jgi:lipoprotein-anchoring transpeptidase ErfK/SrfK
MIARQPYLPRMTAGGPGNPLGARAMYIGGTEYRIHGTNDPTTIGKNVSSGCIRLTNEDVTDLYERVKVGAKVIVLPQTTTAQRKVQQQAQVSYTAPVSMQASNAMQPSSLY